MKIEHKEISIREITEGYSDDGEGGVRGYSGRLDIRPPYQREFIYDEVDRNAVIDTIIRGYPLNTMYWSVGDDGDFEIIDGQQRTISFCTYVAGNFSVNGLGFHNLTSDEQEKILDYELSVFLCSGTDSERLAWFKTINIAGNKLSNQEMRNAVYTGPWVTDAKRRFVRANAPAYGLGSDYMDGKYRRGEYLETVIGWHTTGTIEDYMAKNQHKPDANPLWLYYHQVIAWAAATFPVKRKPMKKVPWGLLYNKHNEDELNASKLEQEVSRLMSDDDVTSKVGIYSYLLNGQEKALSIRAFTDNQKTEAYERQQGICPACKEHFALGAMQADHIKPWHAGGKTLPENCQMLCRADNLAKGGS